MATTIKLTGPPLYYKNGVSGASAAVGCEYGINRVARYTFVSPSVGATSVEVYLPNHQYGGGDYPAMRFYIGLDPSSHANAGPGYDYTGDLILQDDWMSYRGSAKVTLLPSKTYYLWVFPNTTENGWWYWNGYAEAAAITVDGAAASVISGTAGTLGTSHTLFVTRYDSTFTHTITAMCGSAETVVAEKSTASSIAWTPPISWASQNTTGTSVVVVIRCDTYDGNTLVGSNSITLTFAIPASVVPSVSLAVSDGAGHLGTYGSYIQERSKAAVNVTAAGAYGSTIKSYAVSCGSLSGSGASLTFELSTAGEITVKATVTDSRGRTATASTTITVTAYAAPAVSISSLYRCDAEGNEDQDGEYAIVFFGASVVSMSGQNSANYTLRYRVRKTTSWTSVALDSYTGNYNPNGSAIFPAAIDSAYDVSVVAADDFGSVTSAYRTIQVAFALMDFDRENKALGFGMRASKANTASFGLPIAMSDHKITELADPTEDGDAVPLGYVNGRFAPAIESTDYPGCYYRTVNGVTEWINPPMTPGVEYRTAERWRGVPVYTKVIDCGTMSNNKYVETGYAQGAIRILSSRGLCGSLTMAYSKDSIGSWTVSYSFNNVNSKINAELLCGSSVGASKTYIQIWFIKEWT